jgi:hypothetical protein
MPHRPPELKRCFAVPMTQFEPSGQMYLRFTPRETVSGRG